MDGLKTEIRSAGFEVVQDTGSEMGDAEFAAFVPDPAVKWVVVSIDWEFNYRKVAVSSLYL